MTGAATSCDAVTLQIIAGTLRASQSEMEALIERTAMSPFIREKKDFHTGMFDRHGNLVAAAALSGSTNILDPVLAQYPQDEMRDGDTYWYNDCYGSHGAVSHTPDQVLVRPVFTEGRIIAFIEAWAHFNDIGGMHPGTLSPAATDFFQEGTIVPAVRLVREGVMNDDLMRLFCRNSRFPAMVEGDMRALLAAVSLGARRIADTAQRFGAAVLEDAFGQLLSLTGAEVATRSRQLIPQGTHRFTETMDGDGHGSGPIRIRYTLEVTADTMVLDTTASDDQCRGPFNYIMSPDIPAMWLGRFLLSADPDFMVNGGITRSITRAEYRLGSILQPREPAPLGMRGVTSMRTQVAWLGLIAVATGGNSNGANPAYVVSYLRGRDDSGKPFLMTDPIGVGYGARPTSDGNDGIYLTANENYPVEFVESVFPLRCIRYAVAPDSGGPGRWRGGCGLIREMEVLAPEAMFAIRLDSVDFPPWGLNGGMSAARGGVLLNAGSPDERSLPPICEGIMLKRGDRLRIVTGGGGGWGHPHDREPDRVLADVVAGFVSREAAGRDYGIVLTPNGRDVDVAATAIARATRPPTRLFHRETYQDALT